MLDIDVTGESAFLSENERAVLIKIAAQFFEVNIFLNLDAASKLLQFFRNGGERCAAGTSVSSSVHWRRLENSEFFLLIGHDEETWDIGFTLPADTLDRIRAELEQNIRWLAT